MHYSCHRYLHLSYIRHKTLHTIKSRHDEQLNQPLLKRLKNLSVIGEKKTAPRGDQAPREELTKLPERSLTKEKLVKMIKLNAMDPLTWNASVLGRIFNIPEHYCGQICGFIKPMIEFASANKGFVRLVETKFVVDVARFKTDESYLVTYKKIAFPQDVQQSLPKKTVPEYLATRARELEMDGGMSKRELERQMVDRQLPPRNNHHHSAPP